MMQLRPYVRLDDMVNINEKATTLRGMRLCTEKWGAAYVVG